MMKKIAIIASTDRGVNTALRIWKELPDALIHSTRPVGIQEVQPIPSVSAFLESNFSSFDAFIFIGALGICVRTIAPFLQDKQSDPGVINADDAGLFVQSVVSGHAGGANELTKKVAAVLGAQPVITTSTDLQDIWALDLLGRQYGWAVSANEELNRIISIFANNQPTALLFEIKDKGTAYLEKTKPAFADIYYDFNAIDLSAYKLLIAVTFRSFEVDIPAIFYHPKVLNLGIGCSRGIESDLLEKSVLEQLKLHNLASASIRQIGSIDVKHDEVALIELAEKLNIPFITYQGEELNTQPVANPSDVVQEKLGVSSVSEASAMVMSGNKDLLLEKQKITVSSGKMHTLAVAVDYAVLRKGVVAIVGAGPGDADLVSVKGKELLEEADLILYAGSLIPEELTACSKPGALVRNSAGMTLEEQIELMEEHYAMGHLIVRLQSGDPSIYGAIQEQMTIFDEKGMDYYIVPGISSFQAAAAYLKSEFTIPEIVQSIILTRGEGNTPLPEKEKLNEMAKHQATMCIFLSATISKRVQAQLLEHYPEDTPVAILYRVTWKDEEVYTGQLKDLAAIIRKHKLTRTVLIIVGAAIGARKNRSQLYHPEHKHIFRNQKTAELAGSGSGHSEGA